MARKKKEVYHVKPLTEGKKVTGKPPVPTLNP